MGRTSGYFPIPSPKHSSVHHVAAKERGRAPYLFAPYDGRLRLPYNPLSSR